MIVCPSGSSTKGGVVTELPPLPNPNWDEKIRNLPKKNSKIKKNKKNQNKKLK